MAKKGRPPTDAINAIEAYLRVKSKRIKAFQVKKYRYTLQRITNELCEGGKQYLPTKVNEDSFFYLIDDSWERITPERPEPLRSSTKQWYCSIFSSYLSHFGNDVYQNMHYAWPNDQITVTEYAKTEDVITLCDAPLTPLEELMLHFEAFLGMRNVETKRIRLQDIKGDSILIHGKTGIRNIPKHPETDRVINRWLKERNALIYDARKYDPHIEVPDNLIIYKLYKKKPRIGAYGDNSNSFDRITRVRMEEKYGVRIPNHSLRRWFGRTHDELGTDASVIQRFYGHKNQEETEKYIGKKFKQMTEAHKQLNKNNLKKIEEGEKNE